LDEDVLERSSVLSRWGEEKYEDGKDIREANKERGKKRVQSEGEREKKGRGMMRGR